MRGRCGAIVVVLLLGRFAIFTPRELFRLYMLASAHTERRKALQGDEDGGAAGDLRLSA